MDGARRPPPPAGSIVPVYIKSNIQKVYVVGVPGSKGKNAKKIELPLWQIELYLSRRKAVARVKSMGANVSLYMIAARDGLPLRDMPSNSGRRVYRLREGQSVKVLAQAEGEEVSTGGQVLPGSWYRVLTEDGTEGYVFSYALRLYDEAKEGPPVIVSAKEALSGRVDLIFSAPGGRSTSRKCSTITESTSIISRCASASSSMRSGGRSG